MTGFSAFAFGAASAAVVGVDGNVDTRTRTILGCGGGAGGHAASLGATFTFFALGAASTAVVDIVHITFAYAVTIIGKFGRALAFSVVAELPAATFCVAIAAKVGVDFGIDARTGTIGGGRFGAGSHAFSACAALSRRAGLSASAAVVDVIFGVDAFSAAVCWGFFGAIGTTTCALVGAFPSRGEVRPLVGFCGRGACVKLASLTGFFSCAAVPDGKAVCDTGFVFVVIWAVARDRQ